MLHVFSQKLKSEVHVEAWNEMILATCTYHYPQHCPDQDYHLNYACCQSIHQELKQLVVPQEKEEASISEKLKKKLQQTEDEVERDQQEVESDPFVSQPKPSVVYEPPLSETSPGSQSSLEQITTLSITNSPSLSPISFEDNETRQPSSLEHNEPDNLANERGELSSQKDDAILPSLFSHSNDSMKKNEEERDEAIDEQTDHLNQEQTSSETGSKTILTGPIPKPPQDVEVRQYWL